MEYVMANAGQHFSAEIVELFIRKVAVYPTGTFVQLSNGEIGEVCENFKNLILRPKVKIIFGREIGSYVNLSSPENRNITIVKAWDSLDEAH
jgi:hypothetical protein